MDKSTIERRTFRGRFGVDMIQRVWYPSPACVCMGRGEVVGSVFGMLAGSHTLAGPMHHPSGQLASS